MIFWTVGDTGPYKEKSNFLMRTTLYEVLFVLRCVDKKDAKRYYQHAL